MAHFAFSMQNGINYFRWAIVLTAITKLCLGGTINVRYDICFFQTQKNQWNAKRLVFLIARSFFLPLCEYFIRTRLEYATKASGTIVHLVSSGEYPFLPNKE